MAKDDDIKNGTDTGDQGWQIKKVKFLDPELQKLQDELFVDDPYEDEAEDDKPAEDSKPKENIQKDDFVTKFSFLCKHQKDFVQSFSGSDYQVIFRIFQLLPYNNSQFEINLHIFRQCQKLNTYLLPIHGNYDNDVLINCYKLLNNPLDE